MSDRSFFYHVPSTVKTVFAIDLDQLRRLSEEGYPAATHEALRLCMQNPECCADKVPFNDKGVFVPNWLLVELARIVLDYLKNHLTTGKGRHAKWWSRHQKDMIHYRRYEAVEHIKTHKEDRPVWEGNIEDWPVPEERVNATTVWEWASWLLKETDAAGKPETIRSSHRLVKANRESDPGRYRVYRFLHSVPSRVKND